MRVLRLLPALVLLPLALVAARAQQPLPETPSHTLKPRPQPELDEDGLTPVQAAVERLRISKLPIINGIPYDQPSEKDLFHDYLFDTYWYPGLIRSTIRAVYAQARGKPEAWGTDFTGFSERFGSAEAITVINGTVRYGMENLFHEDLRYLPCRGCSAWHKVENALLSEVTARHDETGRRFFTLSPTVADFSGPIIAHTLWYPGLSAGPLAGVVSARTVFATRIGTHLFREFVMEHHHKERGATPPAIP